MNSILQSILTAVVLAAILAVVKLFWDVVRLKATVEPVVQWYVKTSMDALKIATNPTSERLTELADKYIASVSGKGKITVAEKDELVKGLRRVLDDKSGDANKRQSASMSLRFIESREGMIRQYR